MAEISLREYCKKIEETIEQGRYEEAVAHGKQILKQYPKHIGTYRLLGTAMLEAGRTGDAADMFQRVLSADPEDLVAWIGMSEVHKQQGELDAAVHHLERAFELAADNQALEEELRQFYGQRDGAEPARIQLTRGALARLYLRGNLLSRAINEFRTLLAQHPERADLAVALAEALWRNEQRLEATEVCQQLLDRLPYSLKANLILGEIWTSSGREEGHGYLRRAESLDPENQMAHALFGAASPLQGRDVYVTPLELAPPIPEEAPAWMGEAEAPPAEVALAPVDVTSAIRAQIEIPSWLAEIAGEEAVAEAPPVTAPSAPAAAEPPMEEPPEEAFPTPVEEITGWIEDVGDESAEEELEVTILEEAEVPDWLTGLGFEPTDLDLEMEEMPGQQAGPGVEPTGIAETPVALDEEDVPDWLAALGIEETGEEAPAPVPSEELPEDWLTGIRDQFAPEPEAPLESVAAPEDTYQSEEPFPGIAEAPVPEWLADEELSLADGELTWLQEPTSPEDQQAQMEAEARLAEIMGQPAIAPETVAEEAPREEAIPTPVEEAFPAPAEIPEWMAELAPPSEVAAPVEEEPPVPAWMAEGAELPSGDDALAWLEQLAAGKEDELQAQAEAEAEARMAEIMGRSAPAAPEAPPIEAMPETIPEEIISPPVPTAEEEMVEEELEPAPAEIPGWMQEFEPLGEVPEAEAISSPAWLEEEDEEELPLDDEELAWLRQSAEQEDERARAEAEARLAEIMGIVTPSEPPTGEAAPPPAIEEAFPAPAEIPEWMQEMAPPGAMPPEAAPMTVEAVAEEPLAPAAEEAFGWIAFDEPEVPPGLGAVAEEIAPALAEAPVEAPPGAPLEVPVADEEALAPAWMAEDAELPSGDDALAWLERLAAGKEDELRAQAEVEVEARMAEIMGRSAPAAAEVLPVEAVPEEMPAPEDVVAPPMPPVEEVAPTEPVPPPAFEVEEAPVPAWLEEELIIPAEEAPLPEMEAPLVEAEAPPVEVAPAVEFVPEEAVAPPVEEAPPMVEAVPEEVIAPPVEEAIPAEAVPLPIEDIAPPEPAYAEEAIAPLVVEIPAEEPVPVPEVVPAVAEIVEAEVEEPVPPTPAVEEAVAVAEVTVPEPIEPALAEPVAPPVLAVEEPAPAVEEPAPAGPFAAERAHLKAHPRDHEAWLGLARGLWQADEQEEALDAYARLVRAGKHLESVISDLEEYLRQWPSVHTQRLLGDAYMKDGRLQDALDIYRRALETL